MKRDDLLYQEKCNEMMEVYKKVAVECFTQKQAYDRVVNHKASRFFIQPHTAYNRLRAVFKGKTQNIEVTKECEQRMYEELYKRVVELSLMPQHYGASLMQLCEIAVMQEAPEFYMKPEGLRHLLIKQRKIIREQLRNRFKCS